MKQYGIYIRCNGGVPYMIHFYDNICEAKIHLFDMISLEEKRDRPYFVDNDFFKNKYQNCLNLKYYCIKVREVSEFEIYSEKNAIKEEKDKVLYFNNFKKTY